MIRVDGSLNMVLRKMKPEGLNCVSVMKVSSSIFGVSLLRILVLATLFDNISCGTITPLLKPLSLGEGPHWDAEKQMLFYVDMDVGMIHCYDPVTEEHFEATVGPKGTWITLILPVEGTKDKFVVGMNGDLAIITWDCKSPQVTDIKKYIALETSDDVRINDGKCSPSGVIFAGSMAYKLDCGIVPLGRGNLFAVDSRGENPKAINLLEGKVDLSNGLCWNKDETIFYWTDTLQKKVYKLDYDKENLTISNQQVLLDYDKEKLKGHPDGMTIDKFGTIYLASVDGGGQILVIDSNTGEVTDYIDFPGVSNISSVAFGGKNLEDLYVTTISEKDEPLAGSLFVIKGLGTSGYPGVPAKIQI